tara:strand:- start:127 stop:288 length:162 start_codon:yes stop_codon:yes gene_type:complete
MEKIRNWLKKCRVGCFFGFHSQYEVPISKHVKFIICQKCKRPMGIVTDEVQRK